MVEVQGEMVETNAGDRNGRQRSVKCIGVCQNIVMRGIQGHANSAAGESTTRAITVLRERMSSEQTNCEAVYNWTDALLVSA